MISASSIPPTYCATWRPGNGAGPVVDAFGIGERGAVDSLRALLLFTASEMTHAGDEPGAAMMHGAVAECDEHLKRMDR